MLGGKIPAAILIVYNRCLTSIICSQPVSSHVSELHRYQEKPPCRAADVRRCSSFNLQDINHDFDSWLSHPYPSAHAAGCELTLAVDSN